MNNDTHNFEEPRDCDYCGETLDYNNPYLEIGEFYDPEQEPGSKHYICHAECGLGAGYELA